MRNCCIIIEKIIKEIPTNKKDFIADLIFYYYICIVNTDVVIIVMT